jgi:hypothetical protein
VSTFGGRSVWSGLPEDIAFSAHRRALSDYLAREKKRK